MKVEITDIEQSQKELKFSLSPEDMKPYVEKTAQRLGQEMKLKGFRDGKIPASVVQQTLGAETVWNEAIADAIEESYAAAVGEHDNTPIPADAIGRDLRDYQRLAAAGRNFDHDAVRGDAESLVGRRHGVRLIGAEFHRISEQRPFSMQSTHAVRRREFALHAQIEHAAGRRRRSLAGRSFETVSTRPPLRRS